jgi:hypothetical protein
VAPYASDLLLVKRQGCAGLAFLLFKISWIGLSVPFQYSCTTMNWLAPFVMLSAQNRELFPFLSLQENYTMRIKFLCTAIMALAFLSMGSSYADQKIKTKSDIKIERVAPCCKF